MVMYVIYSTTIHSSIIHIVLSKLIPDFTDLRAGDELVTVNGMLVEGMNSSEVIGIIKEAEGDVTVVAKRGGAVVATAVGSDSPPGK